MKRLSKLPSLALGLALAMPAFTGSVLADDDRQPTPEERAAIEDTLRGAGYTSWKDIEFDDGHWEVDDAIGPDGREYDIKLHPQGFGIIEVREDD
ncbi:MAG: hypothetical protein C0454_06740 [Parvibaculum sp.]|nr:hypothetical protein [Parvibaculum sp.]